MEENKNVIEATVTENNGTTVAEVPQKETIGQKIKKSWFWKNRGKIGFGLGSAVALLLGGMLGGNGGDDTTCPTNDIDE